MKPTIPSEASKLTLILAAAGIILLLQGLYVTQGGRIGLLTAGLGVYLVLLAYLEVKLTRQLEEEGKDIQEVSRLIAAGKSEKEYRGRLRTPIIWVTVLYAMVWLLSLLAEPADETNTLTIITTTLGLILLAYATQKYAKK